MSRQEAIRVEPEKPKLGGAFFRKGGSGMKIIVFEGENWEREERRT